MPAPSKNISFMASEFLLGHTAVWKNDVRITSRSIQYIQDPSNGHKINLSGYEMVFVEAHF